MPALCKSKQYEWVRDYVQDLDDGGEATADQFFESCYDLACNKGDPKTAVEKQLLEVHYALNHLGFFPETKNFLKLKRTRKYFQNHAVLKCPSLAKEMARTLETLTNVDAAHPLMTIPASKIIQSGKDLAGALQLATVLEDGGEIPQAFIEQILREERAKANRQPYPFGSHTSEGKRLLAMRDCANALASRKLRCNPNSTRELLRCALLPYNMTVSPSHAPRGDKRTEAGVVVGNEKRTLKGLRLICNDCDLQDQWRETCTCGASIMIGFWDAHRNEHDVVECEDVLSKGLVPFETYKDPAYAVFLLGKTVRFEGIYEEPLNVEVVRALVSHGEPSNALLKSAYETVCRASGVSAAHNVTYHRKHGSAKSWQNISVYHELFWLVLD